MAKDKLIRLDDAIGAVNDNIWYTESEKASVRCLLRMVPAVEVQSVVEIIRCRDCRLEGTIECPMVHKDMVFKNLCAENNADDFCSRGEKR